jgi:hypothetical protein
MYEELQVNARQAQRENVKMSQGEQVTVNTWDDHIAHVEEHDNYRKRQAYEQLPPELQQIFETHVQHHKAMILTHKGIPEPIIQQALNDPSGLMLDRLLFAPMPGMMPPMGGPPPPQAGPSHGPPAPVNKPPGPLPGSTLQGNSPGAPQTMGIPPGPNK